MLRLRPVALFLSLILAAAMLLACGGSHHTLQSVSVAPAMAASQAQFTATGIYSQSSSPVNITATTTWCVGDSTGLCAGNIAIEANVNGGLAQCLSGFSGTVTILAGQAGSRPNPDQGYQLKPFGSAQLTCP